MISVRSFLTLSLATILNFNVHAATTGGITGDGGSVYDGKIADVYWQDSKLCHVPNDAIEVHFQYSTELEKSLGLIKSLISVDERLGFNLSKYKLILVKKLSGEDPVIVNGEVAKQVALSYETCGANKLKVIEVTQDFFDQPQKNQIEILAHEILHHTTKSGHNVVSPIMKGLITYLDLQARQKNQTKDNRVELSEEELASLNRMQDVLEDHFGSSELKPADNYSTMQDYYQFNKLGGGLVHYRYMAVKRYDLDEAYVDTNSAVVCNGSCGTNNVFINSTITFNNFGGSNNTFANSMLTFYSNKNCSNNNFIDTKNFLLTCKSQDSLFSNIDNATKTDSPYFTIDGKNQTLKNLSLDLKNCTTLIKGNDIDLSAEVKTLASTKKGCGLPTALAMIAWQTSEFVNAAICIFPAFGQEILTHKDTLMDRCLKPSTIMGEKIGEGSIAGNNIKSQKDFERLFTLTPVDER